jgi:hypothetical protein
VERTRRGSTFNSPTASSSRKTPSRHLTPNSRAYPSPHGRMSNGTFPIVSKRYACCVALICPLSNGLLQCGKSITRWCGAPCSGLCRRR